MCTAKIFTLGFNTEILPSRTRTNVINSPGAAPGHSNLYLLVIQRILFSWANWTNLNDL